jgi:hypothetical protein
MHIHVAPLATGKNILKDAKAAQIETDTSKDPTPITEGTRVVVAYFIVDNTVPPAVVSTMPDYMVLNRGKYMLAFE